MIPALLIAAALALAIMDWWGDALPDWLVDSIEED